MCIVKVCVAICTWNRCELLRTTLHGFLPLRVPPGVEWELLVINNNCTDATDAVVAEFSDRLPIRLIHERTPGQSYARNTAATAATGEFLLQTDDDALIEPDWMEKMLAAFHEYDADLVFGRVTPWWQDEAPEWFTPLCNGLFALVDLDGPSRLIRQGDSVGAGVNHGFRVSTLRRLGPYRTDLGQCCGTGSGEDSEMFERALSAEVRVAWARDAVVRHYISPARCTKAFFRKRAWEDSLAHLRLLRHGNGSLPAMFGLPRFFVRMNFDYGVKWLKACWHKDEGSRLFHELKLIRFAGLLWNITLRRT